MAESAIDSGERRLSGAGGLGIELYADGTVRRFDSGAVSLLLFPGSPMEGGLTNLYLRRHADTVEWTALLGPRGRTVFRAEVAADSAADSAAVQTRLRGSGTWRGIRYSVTLQLAQSTAAWFWHVQLRNTTATPQRVDLVHTQDLALAPYGAVRMNEYYVSQYVDHTPLRDATHGWLLASRQNQAIDGRFPWCMIGSLRSAVSFATDAVQFYGLAARGGDAAPGLALDLPGRRLQHEHSMLALRDEALQLGPGQSVAAGFFGVYVADHPPATSAADLALAQQALQLPEASAPDGADGAAAPPAKVPGAVSLFVSAPRLAPLDPDILALRDFFPGPWRHEERDERGKLLSFFCGADRHVVLRSKELAVQRPHGHVLRTGRHMTPAEVALTSTAWMSGTFHSQLTQGHASMNRCLSGVRGYLGLFRAHGQRVFVELDGAWRLLDVPSAFEMAPDGCRWIYQHAGGVVEIRSGSAGASHTFTLSLRVIVGPPARFLISHHVALNGDDGAAAGVVRWRREGEDVVATPADGSDLARRFPEGAFRIAPQPGTAIERVSGDELLFGDGVSRAQPYLCLVTAPCVAASLALRCELIREETQSPLILPDDVALIPPLRLSAPVAGSTAAPAATAPSAAARAAALGEIASWFAHDALVHYLAPRGLEQYSGGGWGTRDVCQGPVELLLALGRTEALRDVLCRVLAAQNPDGDWPQWFMFYERIRGIRAGDSHGDIVLWPLVVLGQYLQASGDSALLEAQLPFYDARGPQAGERASVWEHARRALAVIERRCIPGTSLAAYGHGDWNDSLQPVDARLRERLCSAWTVTLHVQALTQLASALRGVNRAADAAPLETRAAQVRRDFQRLLIADGVLAGYALFEESGEVRLLLHPADRSTAVRYSSLAMIHAILEDLLTPAQTREHLALLQAHLTAPDGMRLFDQPLPYHGGPQRLFQRAESAAFFGREIGLMYTHAHLRYAQALAHVGDAERFWHALCQSNPIGMRSLVPAATLRQANCYFSSSDAAFEDRYQASEQYERVAKGTVALDGGWRVYSSGAGIALGLIHRRLLGVDLRANALHMDPVMPSALDGLRAQFPLAGRTITAHYRVGTAGCGVQGVWLNGAPLPFTRAENPHRAGAAVIGREDLQAQLAPGANELQIELA